MLKKQERRGTLVQVTFTLPIDKQCDDVRLLGDFNDWKENGIPMMFNGDGSYTTTLKLEKGKQYQFRYLVDGCEWYNDGDADLYTPNPFGGDNSVVLT